MEGSRLTALAVALLLAVAGCAATPSPSALPSPSPTPSPASPSPSPSPVTCDARSAAASVEDMLAGETFESHYLTINGKLTISVWLVDPAIDTAAQNGLTAANWEALRRGLELSYEIVDRIPCVGRVFENVNPMIVDSDYHSWYMDIIPVRAFVGLENPTTGDIAEAVSRVGTGPAAGRSGMPPPERPAPSGSCTWPQARAAMAATLGPAEDNTAAYLIVGGGIVPTTHWGGSLADVAVQAQIEMRQPADAGDSVLLRRLGEMAGELACVHPSVDQLELFVVDGQGRMTVYARVPGTAIGPGGSPLPASQVLLHHYATPGAP
jgi:hypothetical protein